MALGECHWQYYVAARRLSCIQIEQDVHMPALLEIVKRLYKTESVLPKKKDAGRQRYARNMETVLRVVEQELEISIRNTIAQRQNCYFLN